MTQTGDVEPVSVTVVIPHYEQHRALSLTLAALCHQTHPHTRLQVVVADDGSSHPIDPAVLESACYDLVVVAQERDGFGLARARNLGVETADGDLVVLLDADMLPEPSLVAAHAAAASSGDYWISIGHRLHIDPGELDAHGIDRILSRQPTFREFFARHPQSEPAWRADIVYRTNSLRNDVPDAYRIASGGNLAVWRRFYLESGGTDPGFRQWGGEDIEFAFRAAQHGARFTYTPNALAWHQGLEATSDADERKSQSEQRPLLANRIADRYLRTQVSGRVFTVPHLSVTADISGTSVPEVETFVDQILRHSLGAGVRLCSPTSDRRSMLERSYASDPRVGFEEASSGAPSVISPAPIWALVDLSEQLSPWAVLQAAERLADTSAVSVIRLGGRGAVVRRQHAARLARTEGCILGSAELIDAIADKYGEDEIDPDLGAPSRPPGVAMEGGDVLRDLWWSMSPTQRSLVERTARKLVNLRLPARRT